jgi:hypothetical protein
MTHQYCDIGERKGTDEKMEVELTSADPFAAAPGSIQTRVELHAQQAKNNKQLAREINK